MNKYTLTSFVLFLSIMSFAQSPNFDFKYALKVYNLTSYSESSTLTIYDNAPGISTQYDESSFQFLQPTVAFLWKTDKNNFHEVELTSLRFTRDSDQTDVVDDLNGMDQTIQGSTITNFEISMRYEYILNLAKSKDWKLMPSIGFGANPYFNMASLNPKVSIYYPAKATEVGVRGFVVPRLTYFVSPKLFLDLNIPICVVDLGVRHTNRVDPGLPIEETNETIVDFRQFPKQFSARIGVGLKL